MSGMSVLSDVLKGGSKLEKTTPPKEKNVSDSPENVTAVFVAMFSGLMNSNVNSKGQRTSLVNQDSEEKQSNSNPVQIDQNPNVAESIFGYGNFSFPFPAPMMLQSDFPVARVVNSGESISQGIKKLSLANEIFLPDGLGAAGKGLELAMLKPVFQYLYEDLASTGKTTLKAQGDNLEITQLDKYRQVILDKYGQVIIELLAALSGKISDFTPEGTHLGANSIETVEGRQELTKIIQSWLTTTDDDINYYRNSRQNALYPILNQLNNQLKRIGIDIESMAAGSRETVLPVNVQQQSEGLNPLESKFIQNFQGKIQSIPSEDFTKADHLKSEFSDDIIKEVQKSEPVKSIEFSGTKDVTNQPLSSGAGVAVNSVYLNPADGKIVWLPVWEQISALLREQVVSKQQTLKELDIQLHPEELGKIRIFLRWESGMVHLQVNAAEAVTGQLLQNQLPELRQNLMNQGVNCGSLQMGQNGKQQQPQGDEAQRTFYQSYTLPNEDKDPMPILNPLFLGQDGINRIDVTA